MQTMLKGLDGQVYAVAQGNLVSVALARLALTVQKWLVITQRQA
ncbi:flagellar P-ring protein FlgI [Vibrio astriarenae]|nr:flagellar P-ring protein FlgI [Vibrio sp. C7]